MTDCFEDVLKACVESHKEPVDKNLSGTEEYNAEPIWLLPFIFEQLILCPNPDQPREGHKGTSLRQCITRRLRLFRSGQLELLYQESKCIVRNPPSRSEKTLRTVISVRKKQPTMTILGQPTHELLNTCPSPQSMKRTDQFLSNYIRNC